MIRKEETNNKTGESTQLLLNTILYSSKTHVYNSLLFDQFISNIQEIIDIEWLFELISMCFCVFLSSLQMIRKEEITVKQEKVVNYYYITVP